MSSWQMVKPAMVPAADEIAFLRNGELWWMKSDGTSQAKLASDVSVVLRFPGENADKDFAWSPDGTKIAFVDRTGQLRSLNKDGSSAIRPGNPAPFVNSPAWSPDGKRIALECDGLCIADMIGGIQKVADTIDIINSLVWSRDGSSIYLGIWNSGVYRYDVAGGSIVPILLSDFREFSDLTLRP